MLRSVYIAAPYQLRSQADHVRLTLLDCGILSTARWITQPDSATLCHEWAEADLDDIRAAEALLALNPPDYVNMGTGGRHVELGYALALGKRIYLIGERSNLFHYHHAVTVTSTLAEWMRAVSNDAVTTTAPR